MGKGRVYVCFVLLTAREGGNWEWRRRWKKKHGFGIFRCCCPECAPLQSSQTSTNGGKKKCTSVREFFQVFDALPFPDFFLVTFKLLRSFFFSSMVKGSRRREKKMVSVKKGRKETVFYSLVLFFPFFERRFNSGLRQRREGVLWLLGECIGKEATQIA